MDRLLRDVLQFLFENPAVFVLLLFLPRLLGALHRGLKSLRDQAKKLARQAEEVAGRTGPGGERALLEMPPRSATRAEAGADPQDVGPELLVDEQARAEFEARARLERQAAKERARRARAQVLAAAGARAQAEALTARRAELVAGTAPAARGGAARPRPAAADPLPALVLPSHASDLRAAILWSEILSPPLALRGDRTASASL